METGSLEYTKFLVETILKERNDINLFNLLAGCYTPNVALYRYVLGLLRTSLDDTKFSVELGKIARHFLLFHHDSDVKVLQGKLRVLCGYGYDFYNCLEIMRITPLPLRILEAFFNEGLGYLFNNTIALESYGIHASLGGRYELIFLLKNIEYSQNKIDRTIDDLIQASIQMDERYLGTFLEVLLEVHPQYSLRDPLGLLRGTFEGSNLLLASLLTSGLIDLVQDRDEVWGAYAEKFVYDKGAVAHQKGVLIQHLGPVSQESHTGRMLKALGV